MRPTKSIYYYHKPRNSNDAHSLRKGFSLNLEIFVPNPR